MARNKIQEFIGGLSDFRETTLTDEIKNNPDIEVIDPDKPIKQAQAPRAQASNTGGLTPGQGVSLKTPQGVSEPEEVAETGKGLASVGKALENPAVVNFLADMGIAFAGGRPNEAGTILGQAAKQQVRGQGVTRVAAQLLEGTPLSEIDTSGLAPEDIGNAISMATQQQQVEQGDRRLDQGERGLDIEQQRANLQEEVFGLRERGIEIDEERLGLDRMKTEADIANAKSQIAIAKKRADIQDRVGQSLIDYRQAMIDVRGGGKEATPAEKARLMEARNESIRILTDRLDIERDRLEVMENELEDASNVTFGQLISAMARNPFNIIAGTEADLEAIRDQNLEASGVKDIVNKQRQLVQDLEKQIGVIENDSVQDLLDDVEGETEDTDTANNTDDVDDDSSLGTVNNPITVQSAEDLEGLEPGTVVQNPKGRTGVIKEDGTIDF